MFTAKARYWVNYNGVWHPRGEEFPIDDADIVRMQKHADVTQVPDTPEPQEPQETPEPAKRGRKRKE